MRLVQDGPEVIRLTIHGAPRTKKTSNRLLRAGKRYRILPSQAWTDWLKVARLMIAQEVRKMRVQCPLPDKPYNIAAVFYRDANRGDAVGYYQGLADVLEAAQVVHDDKVFVSWDGSRLAVDYDNPRVELTITEVAA